MDQPKYDLIIVGGGAAGMMAAGIAASRGKQVLLLEKNRSLGEKLKITGGGRCNVTNAEYDVREFLKHFGSAADFLYSPFAMFGVKDTFKFFEDQGLPLVIQARNRVFPRTEKASDVFQVLRKLLDKHHVHIKTACPVKRIELKDGHITGVDTNQGKFVADKYLLATGGISHPETGSTGDGFEWLSHLGHTVHQPTPTIVPLAVADEWVKSLAGVSLSFMKISFYLDEQKKFSKTGKILFTHFGLSGPLILNSASEVYELLLNGLVTAKIDLFPDTDLGSLDDQIIKRFDENKNKSLRTVFKEIAPRGTARAIETLLPEINFEIPVHSITKIQRKQIVDLLKALPVSITGLMGTDRAVAADGGVVLTEVDTRSMKSKLIDNLYIVGDLLHINRPSGGYSLQLCWTTGYVAGQSI